MYKDCYVTKLTLPMELQFLFPQMICHDMLRNC